MERRKTNTQGWLSAADGASWFSSRDVSWIRLSVDSKTCGVNRETKMVNSYFLWRSRHLKSKLQWSFGATSVSNQSTDFPNSWMIARRTAAPGSFSPRSSASGRLFCRKPTEKASWNESGPNSRAFSWIPNCTNNFGNGCYNGTAGDARVAGRDQIWRFTTRNFATRAAMMPWRTWLPCALDAIQVCIAWAK